MAGYKKWKVGPTRPVIYGTGPVGEASGYGFSIRDRQGSPILSVSYATEVDAEAAETVLRVALAKAVYIEKPSELVKKRTRRAVELEPEGKLSAGKGSPNNVRRA